MRISLSVTKIVLLSLVALIFAVGCKKDDKKLKPKSKYVYPTEWTAPVGVDSIPLYINVADQWEIIDTVSWCHPERLEGRGNDTVWVYIDPNPGIYKRTGTINFFYITDTELPKLVITQHGNGYVLNFVPDSLETNISGGAIETTLATNLPWEIVSAPSWATYLPPLRSIPNNPIDSAHFRVNVEPNTGANFRVGEFIVQHLEGFYQKDTLTVYQEGNSTRATDSLSLVALYNSCDGAAWTKKWNFNEPLEKWPGIITEKVTNMAGSSKRVVAVQLTNNNLTGTIPPQIGDITYLRLLWLNVNNLTGSIPASVCGLQLLEDLRLGHNALSGTLPADLGNLYRLQTLSITNTDIEGAIPASLYKLVNAVTLDLSNNNLSGTLPEALGELENIRYFILRNNQLGGAIPNTYLNNYQWPYWNTAVDICPQRGAGFTNCK